MYRKILTYTNFNGAQVSRPFYFNLMESEIVEREASMDGNLGETLKAIGSSDQASVILPELKKIVKWAYGIKSDDGERFIKNDEVWNAFEQSPAYDALFMDLITRDGAAAELANGIMPGNLADRVAELQAQNGFRPGAQTLPQSRIDQLNAAAQQQAQPQQAYGVQVQEGQPQQQYGIQTQPDPIPTTVTPTVQQQPPLGQPPVQDFNQTSTPRPATLPYQQ